VARGKNVNLPFPFEARTVASTDTENKAVNKAEIVVTGAVDYEGLFSS